MPHAIEQPEQSANFDEIVVEVMHDSKTIKFIRIRNIPDAGPIRTHFYDGTARGNVHILVKSNVHASEGLFREWQTSDAVQKEMNEIWDEVCNHQLLPEYVRELDVSHDEVVDRSDVNGQDDSLTSNGSTFNGNGSTDPSNGTSNGRL